MNISKILLLSLFLLVAHILITLASTTQERIENDIAAGKPVVIHVSVALADNENQGIVPVPVAIGNGQDARTNLYWGARYGLKTYLLRDGGWEKIADLKPDDKSILERLVLKKNIFT